MIGVGKFDSLTVILCHTVAVVVVSMSVESS